MADVYNIKPHQIASSSFAIKNLFWSYFTTMMVNVNQPVILTSCVDRKLMTVFLYTACYFILCMYSCCLFL